MSTITATKRVTMATIKAFIRKNQGQLQIRNKSHFDGMTDCVEECKSPAFRAVQPPDNASHLAHTLGIRGAWFVGQSRDYFTRFENQYYFGYEISNSCGSFVLAVPKWKHTTTDNILQDRAGIDLFNDEQPGYTTIYYRMANGTRCPGRSVIMADSDHAASVLGSWCTGQAVNDYRNEGLIPLARQALADGSLASFAALCSAAKAMGYVNTLSNETYAAVTYDNHNWITLAGTMPA